MAVDTVHKKRAGITAGMPFYASSTSLGSPISMSDKWESAWTYPIGQYDLTANFSDLFLLIDSMNTIGPLALADLIAISDTIELVIPSWLRALRVEEVEHYIIIKRIR